MPDESTTPVGTTQTSQNTQTVTNQSGNDFMLDFGDLGDAAPVAEEIEVDSLSQEEKTDDEFGFDINLGGDNESSDEDVANESETENSVAKDVSVNAPEEEPVNDFDLSMDSEGTNEEEVISDNEEIIPDEEEVLANNEEIVVDKEEVDSENEEIIPEKKPVSDEEEIIPEEDLSFTIDDVNSEELVENNEEIVPENLISDNEEIALDKEEADSENKEIVSDKEPVSDKEEIIPDEEETSNEEGGLNFVKDEDNESEGLGITDQPEEGGHLFHQVNEDDENEISFDLNQSNDDNETSQFEESSENKPLFMSANDDTIMNESGEGDGEISFDLPEVSDNSEKLSELDMEAPEQKQPELGDLLSNSPIDLSKELNDTPENSESDLMSQEALVDNTETLNSDFLEEDTIPESDSEEITFKFDKVESNSEPIQEDISETVLEDTAPETTLEPSTQEVESHPATSVESNEFLLDVPQVEPDTQNIQENSQQETVENVEVTEPEEQTQTDATIDMVNNTDSHINEQNVEVPEINISTPVELSDMSSNQRESTPSETDGQVQSTLSLDQILDSELLSNPQYTDNSKASPQNLPASGGKSKAGIFIGVGVAVLGCCVAFLAFPSITTLIKPVDTVSTGTVVEYPTTDDPHSSAPDEPTGRQDPIGVDNPQTPENPDLENPNLENLDISGGDGGATAVSIIDDEDDSGDGEAGSEPVPYVWTDDGQSDEPEIQESVVEEIDANQILDTISSFKSQGERYYSYGEEHADKQLMKYAQRLVALCDNYRDKVNNGEGTDSESLASFKTTANKILNKIATYLGGDEEVQVIREATIDGESYFEGKDELKEYLYNNR